MVLKIFNTFTRQKEEFKPMRDKEVGLYTCGPTVYDYDHLGHAWNYTMADILRRVLEYNGYQVRHVMNITDVGHLTSDADTGEDKMEKSARREGKSVWEIADYYTKIYLANRKKLNLEEPHVICKATDHIKEIIEFIKRLEAKGVTYKINDGIYFDVAKFPAYGKLSGNTLDKLKAGARVEVNPEKKHPADFALWKFSPKDSKRQMEWDSPWGRGFPGWHIECSAMSIKYLGESFDFHTGGEDNIFPHHECEIAQSETATGKKFVNYWFHTRFLMVEGEKMSKSFKNFYTIKDIEERGFSPLALRYLFLTAHHNTPINFTWKSLEAAQNALDNLYEIVSTWDEPRLFRKVDEIFEKRFQELINDDLDMPGALALVWELVKSDLPSKIKKATLLRFDRVLGLGLDKVKKKKAQVPKEVWDLVYKREEARKNKNWQEADEFRRKVEERGFLIEDTKEGPKIKIK